MLRTDGLTPQTDRWASRAAVAGKNKIMGSQHWTICKSQLKEFLFIGCEATLEKTQNVPLSLPTQL